MNGRRSLGAPDDQIFFMETWMGDGDKTRMKMMSTVGKCLPAHPPWGPSPSHAQHTSSTCVASCWTHWIRWPHDLEPLFGPHLMNWIRIRPSS